MYIYIYIYRHTHTHTHTIESWPEWDLNPRPLNSVIYIICNSFSSSAQCVTFW